MIQQINLYQARPLPRGLSLGFDTMARVCVASALVLASLWTWAFWEARALRTELVRLEARKEGVSQRLEQLAERAASHTQDAALAARLARLQAEERAKTELLKALQTQTLARAEGFSLYLTGLARQHVPGLWLRIIRVSDGGRTLEIEGSASRPGLVPEYLHKLRRERAFAGREFRTFLLDAEREDAPIDFRMSTRAQAREEPAS